MAFLLCLGIALSPPVSQCADKIPEGIHTIQQREIGYSEVAENEFNQGIILYQNGEYQQAALKFSHLVDGMAPHQRITAAYLMYGKTLQKLGKYEDSSSYLQALLEKYENTTYADDAHYCLAINYYSLLNFYDSAREFIWVIDNSPSERLWKESARLLEDLADAKLSIAEMKNLDVAYAGARSKVVLTVKLAECELQEGRKADALARLEKFVELYPSSNNLPRIRSLLEWARSESMSKIRIGVILPLTGFFAAEGSAVLRGMHYGLKKYTGDLKETIELVVRDSESDIVKAVQHAQEMARDRTILCVLGELDNVNSVAVGAALSATGLPLLIPVTTDNGLTTIGDRIFQLNPNLDRQGSEFARYAIEELGLRNFVTFAPQDHYGHMMTDSFVETVDALGGQIVAQKWYYEGTTDVGRQMKSIREIGLKRDLLARLNEEMGHVTTAQVDSAWRAENEKFMEETEEDEDILETKEIPVLSIDAAFFPIYNEDISIIAPQFRLENIHAQILGGGYWNDAEQLRLNKNYVEEVIFVTDHYVDEYSGEYAKFRDDYRIVMQTTPEKMDFYGYDAMNLVLKAISNGGTYRDSFINNLLSLSDYLGVKGAISFESGRRTNSEITILRYSDGIFQKLY